MKTLLVLIAAVAATATFAQKAPIKFGDVPIDQLKQTVYEKDTSAAAYYIADYGQSELRYVQGEGFKLYFDRLTRIKILKKEGLEWANFRIPLYHDGDSEERLSGMKAVTYNLEDGKIVETKVKSDGVFKEKYDENFNITKVTLPNVKVGSVIEFSYKVTSDFVFNFHNWEFQYTIPVVWSEYRASIPEYYHYDKYMEGYLSITEQGQEQTTASINFTSFDRGGLGKATSQGSVDSQTLEYSTTNSRWVMRDVPAFKEEPYMTTANDYTSKMKFELSMVAFPNQPVKNYRGSWETLNEKLLESEYLGKAGESSNFLRKIAEEKTAGLKEPKDKIAAIYAFVRDNVEWDGAYSKYSDNDFKKVLETKKANSGEINLLLVALLRKCDLIASPVLISTRDHGFVREQVAMSSQFNYVVAAVKTGDIYQLLDATDHSLPMSMLPQRCLNGQGFMLSSVEPGWLALAPVMKTRTVTSIDLSLQNDGELKGKIVFNREGYHAQEMRKSYFAKGEADYCKDLASRHSWELHKSEFENVKKLSEPVSETHELTIAEQAQSGGGLVYLNPLLIHRMEENPFKSADRKYPVDFGAPFQQLYTGKISIPDGLVVEELPKPKVIVLPNNAGRYVYSVAVFGNNLSVTSQFSLNTELFTQNDYPALREFYAQVVAKQAEQVVLKKK